MRKAAVIAALLVVATSARADQPLTFWRYGMPDQWLLQQALDCAIGRWRAATCLPVDVSYGAAHWVRFATAADLPAGGIAWTSGSWYGARIRVLESLQDKPRLLCDALAHELRHILARENGHPGPVGSMSHQVVLLSGSKVTAEDIETVCAKQSCGCFAPEE